MNLWHATCYQKWTPQLLYLSTPRFWREARGSTYLPPLAYTYLPLATYTYLPLASTYLPFASGAQVEARARVLGQLRLLPGHQGLALSQLISSHHESAIQFHR